MFSTQRKSGSGQQLVTYSNNSFFTSNAASIEGSGGNMQNDLITFLSIVQKCKVDFLAVMPQPALGALGEGGSGTVGQATVTNDMSFAFKQFHGSGDSDDFYLPLISEVLILSQPPIQNHPNIVNLEGVCWEINPRSHVVLPVLIFEKAAWDLQQFMNVSEGMNLSIDRRLDICADIGRAIMALHDFGKSF
jgi:hypothetical protein